MIAAVATAATGALGLLLLGWWAADLPHGRRPDPPAPETTSPLSVGAGGRRSGLSPETTVWWR